MATGLTLSNSSAYRIHTSSVAFNVVSGVFNKYNKTCSSEYDSWHDWVWATDIGYGSAGYASKYVPDTIVTAGSVVYTCIIPGKDTIEHSVTSFTYYNFSITSGSGGSVSYGKTKITEGETQQFTVDETSSVTLTATPSSNYRFVRWSTGSTSATAKISLSDNLAIVAYFEKLPKLTVKADANGSVTTNPSGYVQPNATYRAVAVAKDGYRFVGWYSGGQKMYDTATADLQVYSTDITYTAQFASMYHAVTVGLADSSPAGSGTVKMLVGGEEITSGTSLIEGTEVQIVCAANLDYNFSQWLVNGVGAYTASHSFIVSSTDATTISCLAVLTERNTYNLSVTKVDPSRGTVALADSEKSWNETGGAISVTGHSGIKYTVTANVTSAISATGRELNKFSGFTKNGAKLSHKEIEAGLKYQASFTNGNNLADETLDDIEIVATFAQKTMWHAELNIPVAVGGTAVIEPEPDSTTPNDRWLEGTITAVATPSTGYYVNSFNVSDLDYGPNGHVLRPIKDSDGKYRDSFTLNYNAKITVNFLKIPCTVSVSVDSLSVKAGAGTASVRSTAQGGSTDAMVYGDVAIFEATSYAGYQFGGWYDADGNAAPDSVIVDGGVATTYRYTDAEYRISLTADTSLVAKFKASVTIGISITASAHGTVSLDDETSSSASLTKWVVIGATCDIKATPQTAGVDFFGSWYDATDTEFTNPLDLSDEETLTVLNTISYVARFNSSADALYLAMCNIDNNTEEGDTTLGALRMMTSGVSPVEVATCTEAQFLTATGLPAAPSGAVKYYTLTGTFRVMLNASPLVGRGFSRWTRLVVSNGQAGDEIQLSNVMTFSTVANRHYIYRAWWGDPRPARITLNYCIGSDVTDGNLQIEGISVADASIEDKTQTGEETSATYTQNDVVKIYVDVKNGNLFDGWYYDAEHTMPLRDSEVGDAIYRYTDAEYSFVVSSPVTIYAKFKEDANALYKWEGSLENKMITWKSKVYVSPRPFDPSTCRVDADGYSSGSGGSLRLTVDMFSSPNTDATPTSVRRIALSSQGMRRIQRCRPEKYIQIQVESNNPVNNIVVGTSAQGVAV